MSKDTVWIGCKLPNGHYLQIHRVIDSPDPKMGKTTIPGERHLVRGTNSPHAFVVGDFGLTELPADFWSAWSEQHKDSPMVINGLIFAEGTERGARKEAQKREKLLSGFEPLDPDNPDPNTDDDDPNKVTPTDEQKKATAKARASDDGRNK